MHKKKKALRESKKELIDNKEEIIEWTEPIESTGSQLLLSSSMFTDNDKKVLHPTFKDFSLELCENIKPYSFVRKGQCIGHVVNRNPLYRDYTIEAEVFAHKDGWIVENHYTVALNGILATIYDSQSEAIESDYPCKTEITTNLDDFTSNEIASIILSFPLFRGVECGFFLVKDEAYFKLWLNRKELLVQKGSKLQLLFESSQLGFEIIDKPIRDYNSNKSIIAIKLSKEELNVFCCESIVKAKLSTKGVADIEFKKPWWYHGQIPSVVRDYHLHAIAVAFRDYINNNGITLIKSDNVSGCDDNSTCYVYLMKDETNGAHKIGISNKPEYREKTLQSDKPFITLLQAKEFPSRVLARAFESALHKTYGDQHIRGEWFNLNDNDVEDIIKTLQ